MMKSFQRLLFGTVVLAAMASGCAEMGMGPGGSSSSGVTSGTSGSSSGPIPTTGRNRVASGHHGDTLDACLARIPNDASSGQKMLAEKSCQRDHSNRKAIDQVPGQ